MKSAKVFAALTASALLISPSFASEVTLLPAGKPAGVQQAELAGPALFWLAGIAIIAGGIALVASNNNNTTTTTTTTGTSS